MFLKDFSFFLKWKIYFRKIVDILLRGLRLAPNTDVEELASLMPGYVGADLSSLAREAAISAVNR